MITERDAFEVIIEALSAQPLRARGSLQGVEIFNLPAIPNFEVKDNVVLQVTMDRACEVDTIRVEMEDGTEILTHYELKDVLAGDVITWSDIVQKKHEVSRVSR